MVEQGWTVQVKADPWEVGHWYGYDAHTVAENTCGPRGGARRARGPSAGPGLG